MQLILQSNYNIDDVLEIFSWLLLTFVAVQIMKQSFVVLPVNSQLVHANIRQLEKLKKIVIPKVSISIINFLFASNWLPYTSYYKASIQLINKWILLWYFVRISTFLLNVCLPDCLPKRSWTFSTKWMPAKSLLPQRRPCSVLLQAPTTQQ